MSKSNNLSDFLMSLANKLRQYLKTSDKINPQNFEDKIDAVYEAAAQEAYDDFWDTFQQNGERTAYEYAFGSDGWTNDIFKPKYNIRAAYGNHGNIFSYSGITGSLKQILNDLGITLSFYQKEGRHYGANYVFIGTKFTELPVLDFSEAEGNIALQTAFSNNPLLETIEKVILPTDCTGYGTNTFQANYALKNIDFGGTIKYTLSFQWNPLTADSMKNIFDHLDTADSDSARTVTVKTAVKTAYNEKYGDWDAKVAHYSTNGNWTFSII